MNRKLSGMLVVGAAAMAVAGCAPDATNTSASVTTDAPATAATAAPATAAPVNQDACTAVRLAAAGEWSQAEIHWLTVESKAAAASGDTTTAYQLLTDTEAVAMDKLSGTSVSVDLATYITDLMAAKSLTAGC